MARRRHRAVAWISFICCLLATATCRADIWEGMDADGVSIYSDRPSGHGFRLLFRVADSSFETASPARLKQMRRRYMEEINRVAASHGLEPELLHAVVAVESGYNHRALSAKGAQGLMQLMPGTAKRYGLRQPYDVPENLDAGARYLKDLLAMFSQDLSLALAAYNAGEGAVMRYGQKIPPYAETRRYVADVLARYRGAGVGPG